MSSYYRLFILEPGVDSFHASERHNGDKADKFAKGMHHNLMAVTELPDGVMANDEALLDYIARHIHSAVYASRDGYIIEDCDLVIDIFWKDAVRQKLLEMFPRHKILAVMNHTHVSDFGYAFFDHGKMQRIFHIMVEDETGIESDCYQEGEMSDEELNMIKRSLTTSDNLNGAYDVMIGAEVYKDVLFEDMRRSMIEWALARFSVSDSLDYHRRNGCSLYRKRPWWYWFIPGQKAA